MSDFKMMVGDVFEQLALLPDESVDTCVTSPPYWGLRDYGYEGQIGLEPTLGEHLDVMVRVFEEIRRVLKPMGTCFLNYGDCYATTPNGRSAADVKALGTDDRTFRDKPVSTIGPIRADNLGNNAGDGVRRKTVGPVYVPIGEKRAKSRGPKNRSLHDGRVKGGQPCPGQIHAGGYLKPKDLCMIPNRLAIALQDAGWWVRSEIVWGKPNPMPDSSGKYRPSTAHEKIWLLTKSAKSYYDAQAVKMPVSGRTNPRVAVPPAAHPEFDIGLDPIADAAGWVQPAGWDTGEGAHGSIHRAGSRRAVQQNPKAMAATMGVRANPSFQAATTAVVEDRYLRNFEPDISPLVPLEVWKIASAAFTDAHFATFPPALVVPCILSGCPEGGTVLDPFGGAGTTALVAQALGRSSILIEMSEEYAAIAERRVMNGNLGFGLEV